MVLFSVQPTCLDRPFRRPHFHTQCGNAKWFFSISNTQKTRLLMTEKPKPSTPQIKHKTTPAKCQMFESPGIIVFPNRYIYLWFGLEHWPSSPHPAVSTGHSLSGVSVWSPSGWAQPGAWRRWRGLAWRTPPEWLEWEPLRPRTWAGFSHKPPGWEQGWALGQASSWRMLGVGRLTN